MFLVFGGRDKKTETSGKCPAANILFLPPQHENQRELCSLTDSIKIWFIFTIFSVHLNPGQDQVAHSYECLSANSFLYIVHVEQTTYNVCDVDVHLLKLSFGSCHSSQLLGLSPGHNKLMML